MKLLRSLLLSLALINPAFAVDYVAGPGNNGGAGQIIGTSTNDNACAGCVGEVITANNNTAATTVTITIAAPGIVTWAAHGFTAGSAVYFTTTSALPTGITPSVSLWVCGGATLQAGSFALATSVASAIAGTCLTTSGTQSGVQTGNGGLVLVSAAGGGAGAITNLVQVTAGDWNCWGGATYNSGGAATLSGMLTYLSLTTTSTPATFTTAAQSVNYFPDSNVVGSASTNAFPLSDIRVSVAVTTPVYLGAEATFSASSMVVNSSLTCRRAR